MAFISWLEQSFRYHMARVKYIRGVRFLAMAFLLFGGILPITATVKVTGEGRTHLHGSIRNVADAPTTGRMNPRKAFITRRALQSAESAAPLEFEVALKMRNFAELQSRISKGKRIPLAEMVAKYEPLPADYQKVAAWVAAQGLTITQRDPHHMILFVQGKVSQIQQAMQVTFARVTQQNKTYTSAISEPSVPASLSPLLVGINGLQPQIRPQRHLIMRPASSNSSTTAPYTPSQVAKAYQANGLYSSGIDGTGQTIAIVIDVFPAQTDITSFWQNYGIARTFDSITEIPVGTPAGPPDPALEATLDVEWSSSIAPGAKIRIYGSGSLGTTDLDQCYQQIYTDVTTHPEYAIHQMSMSYGSPETEMVGAIVATDDQLFAELAAAGVSIFVSTGDGGASPGPGGSGDNNGALQAENPASDPNVTAVGGTTLLLDGNGNPSGESVWSLSGGGASIYFNRPTWQTGTGVPAGNQRLLPDVSCVADPNTGAVFYYNGADDSPIGGTSWSCPTWAAFCALINQSRANASLPPIGLLGPHLYSLIGTSNFRDITIGNNSSGTSGGLYNATPGYDEGTGIGVPQVQTLVQTLTTAIQPTVTLLPAYLALIPGQNGTFTATASGSPISYQWQRMPFGSTTWSNLANGGAYSGATSSSLTISSATQVMSGDRFQCLVTYAGNIQVDSLSTVSLAVQIPWVVKNLTSPVFNGPSGIALDNSGNLYIADFGNNQIRMVTPAGVVTTPYGDTGKAAGSTDGQGNTARFNQPNAIVFDGSNKLYVADATNNLIRRITLSTQQVTTIAGHANPGNAAAAGDAGFTDGAGTTVALFNNPNGIAIDGSGHLFVADTNNNAIRKIDINSGQVTTLAGHPGAITSTNPTGSGDSGYRDGAGTTEALFYTPLGLTVDTSGNVFVADMGNNVVRKITSAGVVSTFAGIAGMTGFVDGPNAQAQFNAPNGVMIDAANNIYVTDAGLFATNAGNNLIRKISSSGVVTTLAGQAGVNGAANGTGSAAQFYAPQAVVINATTGIAYIADTFNGTIRMAGFAPTIATPPVSQIITIGQPVSFSVTASGSGTFTYQWLKNGSTISGATSAIFTIPSVASGNAGNYSVKVTTAFGNITSTAATLIPVTAQPVAQTATAGQSVTFTITVAGAGSFTYQWYKNGILISGATGSSYTLPSSSASDAGSYTVVVTSSNGTATSNPVTLTVNPAPATDTPTMPWWALGLLAVILYGVAGRFLSQKQLSSFPNGSA